MLFQQLALDSLSMISEEEFKQLKHHYFGRRPNLANHYHNREEYRSRLEQGVSVEGRQFWGHDFDIAIAAICIGKPIFSIGKACNVYRCYNPTTGRCTTVDSPECIGEQEIVLVNSGNIHWMPTEVRSL